jgi:geranylgeranyl pyrophosphate synthase
MDIESALESLAPTGSELHTRLRESLAPSLVALERRLRAEEGPQIVRAIGAELYRAGGKRLRALASLSVALALDVADDVAVALAEAVELTHGATLLHDDVIDEAETRRGEVAARRRWSNTLSVLAGDFLLLRAQSLVSGHHVAKLSVAHQSTLHALLSAEVAQHVAKRDLDCTTEGYIAIARGKTGALFGFACAAPAWYRENEAAASALDTFGQELGVAFQIADDLRDVLQTDPTKPTALDLKDGVLSLPLRLAAQQNDSLRQELLAAIDFTPSTEEAARLCHKVAQNGAIHGSFALGLKHLAAGRAAIADLRQARLSPPGLATLDAVGDWLEGELLRLRG